jgi:RND family efflux transporter MFP subunit
MMMHRAAPGLALAVLMSGCSLLPTEPALPPLDITTPVTTQREIVTVRRGPLALQTQLQVTFGAERQQALYTRSDGRLKTLHAQVGERVAEGAVLAELEAGSLTFDVARAELMVKRRTLALTMLEHRKDPAATPEELAMARLDLQEAELILAQANELLAATRVVAPFAGTIVSMAGKVGDEVKSFKDLIILAGAGGTVARAQADPATAAQIHVGQTVNLYPNDSDPTPLVGRVIETPSAANAGTNGPVVIAFDQSSPRARPGLSGRAEVVLQQKDEALLIPKSAIKTYGGMQFVTVVKGESRQEVAIETGLDNGVTVAVTKGLSAGDQVLGR